MSGTYDNGKKSSQAPSQFQPQASYLQTRDFAPLQTDLDEDAEATFRPSGYTENFLGKLIDQRSTESFDTPIQAKPMNRLKAIAAERVEIQSKPSTNAALQNQPVQRQEFVEEKKSERELEDSKEFTMNPEPPPVQRKSGNRLKVFAAERMAIQAKLTIGQPNDKYEQEADATAARVVQQINSPITSQSQPVQRQEIEEDEELQMKPLIQRRESIVGGEASTDLESAIQSARGSGQSLDANLQQSMGQAMGADFSGVKVHTDSQSDQLNKSIQAKAFTTGQDLFFRQGAYEPSSRGGQELIAHELTHVVQQNGGAVQRMNHQIDATKSVVQRAWVEDDGVHMWDQLVDGVTWFAQGSEVMWFNITDASEIKDGREDEYKLYEGQKKSSEQWEALRLAAISKDELGGMSQEAWQKFVSGQKNSIKEELETVSDGNVPPESIQDLVEHASRKYTYWRANDDILLGILLGPFEANWFKAKACLTMGQWPIPVPKEKESALKAAGVQIMQALVDMRTRKWKAFTDRIKPEFTERMRMYEDQELQSDVIESQKEKGQGLLNIFDSVGAQAVTSDVDLSTGGSNSELGIQFVNSKFRLEFVNGRVIPYDPGTVFDINLYASDWIHGEAGFSDSGGVRTITPKPEVQGLTAEAEKERTRKMEVWSLVKVRRNMDDKEWESYSTMTLSSLTDKIVQTEMEQKLLDADFEYQTFKLRVETKQQEMEERLKSQEAAFFNGRESAFGSHDEYQEEAHFTRAANAIYEETLTEVKLLRSQINKLKAVDNGAVINAEEINNLGIQLGNKIAEALTYANEVYATEGAVQHTVLKQGAKKKLEKLKGTPEKPNLENAHLTGVDYNIKPELYLQSVNENVGDSLHSINHFKNVPHYAVYRAGKYLSRLCDAAEQLLTKSGAKKAPFYEDLALIGKNAVRVKAINVQGIEGDPEYVKQDSFFKDYNDSNLSTVREAVITFGAKIPQLFNEKKLQEQEQQKLAQEQQKLVQEQQKPVAEVGSGS
jgi:hypothetical protein